MTLMEQRSLIDARKIALEKQLDAVFETVNVNGEKCFWTKDNRVFTITVIYSRSAIVVEYAENMAAAVKNAYEDGDLFFLKELDEKEMLEAILQEINQF